jgi:hypothetical protein
MTIKYMNTMHGKHMKALKPNSIRCQHRESAAQEYEHAHWHAYRVAPPHERWHDSLCKAQH